MSEEPERTSVPAGHCASPPAAGACGSQGLGLKHAWLCVFLAFLFLRFQLDPFLLGSNRAQYFWQRGDGVGVLLAVLALGAVLFAVQVLLRALGRAGRWVWELGLVALCLFFLKVAVGEMTGMGPFASALCKVGIGLCVVGFLFRPRRILRAVEAVCLVLSPAVLLYAVTLAGARSFTPERADVRVATPPSVSSASAPSAVFVFLLDEWSYHRTTDRGCPLPEYPSLRRAASASVVFRNAYSPDMWTIPVLSSLLCGAVGTCELNGDGFVLREADGSEPRPMSQTPTLFSQAKSRGRTTAMYAWCYPWAEVFGQGLDSCRGWTPYRYVGPGPFDMGEQVLLDAFTMRVGPYWPALARLGHRRRNGHLIAAQQESWAAVLADIRFRAHDVVFVHFFVPHGPCVFDADGPRLGPHLAEEAQSTLDDYMGSMRYADRLVGEVLDAMCERPDADRILWVWLADHSFRKDPALRGGARIEFCRVPLLVHLPGQAESVCLDQPFATVWLTELLLRCLDGEGAGVADFVPAVESMGQRSLESGMFPRFRRTPATGGGK